MGPSQKLLWKIYIAVLGAVTTLAAKQLVSTSWKVVTGDKPPNPTDPETPVFEAVSWALASGVGVGVTQLLTQRMAARHWSKDIGTQLPDGGKLKIKI